MLLSPSDCSLETQPTREVPASSKKEHERSLVLNCVDMGKITESAGIPQSNRRFSFLYVYLHRKLELAISSGQNYPIVYSKPRQKGVAEV